MNDSGTMYDFMSDDYEAPVQSTAPKKAAVETPHANRQDLSKPYSSEFKSKCESAPAGQDKKTSAENEWWLFFTRQNTVSDTAMKVNKGFNRAALNGDNYSLERDRYIKSYGEIAGI
jgi:hypothetical protein